MLFLNDIKDHINDNIEDLFTYNELKLFLIIYADDQVAFVKSLTALQSILNDIETYCNTWGLKVNT